MEGWRRDGGRKEWRHSKGRSDSLPPESELFHTFWPDNVLCGLSPLPTVASPCKVPSGGVGGTRRNGGRGKVTASGMQGGCTLGTLTTRDFQRNPLLPETDKGMKVEDSFSDWAEECNARIARTKELEEENNRLFIACFGLQEVLSPEVSDEQITLARPNRGEDIRRLISYAIGCMMGRHSLDRPDLVYAGSGNAGFDAGQYCIFPADEDGIVPLTEFSWFPHDIAHRLEQFVALAWPKETLEANLKFIADSLGSAKNEHPRDTIRRYLACEFYKDHLKTYKRRPIYRMFSSGKLRSFQQRPLATLTRNKRTSWPCQPGTAKDKSQWMAPDFDAPLEDFKEYM